MSEINLTISELNTAYSSGHLTPRDLINTLRDKALTQSGVWIHVLSLQELEPYLNTLKKMSPATHPLYGIPFAIKDNIDLAGIPTTAACPDFTYTPNKSAFVVEQLIAAGAIPIGKTNLDQFATGLVGTRSAYGETPNSFNASFISGGSSSGSAVATASGIVSFALGTDTAGSGRVPAGFNNLIGVKPSKGLLSNSGMVPACKSIDCMSIFTLTAQDANLVFEIAAQYDESDSFSRKNPISNQKPILAKSSFKFAVPKSDQLEFFGDKTYAVAFEDAVEQLISIGGSKVELDFTPFFEAAKLLYQGPWISERFLATKPLIESNPDALLEVTRTIISAGSKPSALDCFDAFYKLQDFKRQADIVVAQVDFLVTPTAAKHFTRDELRANPIELNSQLGYYTNFMNLLDYAAIAVPSAITDTGLPFGITLFSFAMTDQVLLAYANQLMKHNKLPLGATNFAYPSHTLDCDNNQGFIDIAVCGAHLSGMPLNHQLLDRDAVLVKRSHTAKCYKMFAIEGTVERPALIKSDKVGRDFEVEIWRMPIEHFASFVSGVLDPLAIGQLELENNTRVCGFVAQSHTPQSHDISEYGGWRNYIAAK